MIPLYFFEEFAHISILSFLKDRSVPLHIELVGSLAALITTLCWVPQIIKIVRHRETGSISL